MIMNLALMNAISRAHLLLYKMTSGAIGKSLAGYTVLLLTTTGRKSGKPRTVPLQYLRDGANMVVVASNGGNSTHPAWWLNLEAHPEAVVQVGRNNMRVLAERAGAEERNRLWPLLVERYAGYEGYERGTKRVIPVVILRPQ